MLFYLSVTPHLMGDTLEAPEQHKRYFNPVLLGPLYSRIEPSLLIAVTYAKGLAT